MIRRRPKILTLSSLLFPLLLASPSTAQAPAPPAQRFAVVLDAAHGGDDAGATIPAAANPLASKATDASAIAPLAAPAPATEPEKLYTLALSVRLRSLLTARGMMVTTTRESDVTLDSLHRVEIANRVAAQACLTLHASATGSGVHLFLSSLPPTQPVELAPWKTAQSAWVSRSLALAGVLNAALRQAGVKVTIGRTALTTIDSMTCPAVALEVAPENGAGNNSGKGSAVDDPDYEAKIAGAVAAALVEWRSDPAHPENIVP